MNWMSIQRIVGLLLMLFSTSMLTPIIVGIVYSDATWQSFLFSFAITIIIGFIAWYPVRENKKELKLRDGFMVVALFWIVLGSFGAIPFLALLDEPPTLMWEHQGKCNDLFSLASALNACKLKRIRT